MIRVGLTERHGMAVEQSQFAPDEIVYSFLKPTQLRPPVIRSPIKGYMRSYDVQDVDIVEAIISPVLTSKPWIFSCENLQAPTAFSLWRIPLPRSVRVSYIKHVLMKDNCKKIVFWSRAGLSTLQSYGGLDQHDDLFKKATVVYPAVRKVPDRLVRFSDADITLLFSGDFFRKGGVNVVDAFERARRVYPGMRLLVCCDERIDFNSPNKPLREEYLGKVHSLDGIEFLGRVPRDSLIEDVLPQSDVYLLPTYAETFGMSILEAMAFGIPVVATNHFAIPEIVNHDETGLLIDIGRFDTERMFKGYVVDTLPSGFRDYVTDQLFECVCKLAKSLETRRQLGMAALARARTRFSFDTRNARMSEIYREALR